MMTFKEWWDGAGGTPAWDRLSAEELAEAAWDQATKATPKIIQFQHFEDEDYGAATFGLGDDGVIYTNEGCVWEVYQEAVFKK